MKSEKIDLLINHLEDAEKYLSEFKGGYSGKYLCASEFYSDFKKELEILKQGKKESIEVFYYWFSPTCEWDDFTNSDKNSANYSSQIFQILDQLK